MAGEYIVWTQYGDDESTRDWQMVDAPNADEAEARALLLVPELRCVGVYVRVK